MDEMMDLVQILVRYPDPPAKGPGILTASGAYVGLTNDFAEEIGLELPELDPATLKKVGEVLPAYGNYGNPLDVTAGFAPDALSVAAKALLDDPNTGHAVHLVSDQHAAVRNLQQGHGGFAKAQGVWSRSATLGAHARCHEAVGESSAVSFALVGPHDARDRALHRYGRRSRAPVRANRNRSAPAEAGKGRSRNGSQENPRRPASRARRRLARTPTTPRCRQRVGYPVALKAQAPRCRTRPSRRRDLTATSARCAPPGTPCRRTSSARRPA
jgi:acyl-CoA synthetase (NDP forming)